VDIRGGIGLPGTSLLLLGAVATTDDLPDAGNAIGDLWLVNANGYGYRWDGLAWQQSGAFRGPQGLTGERGLQGAQGIRGWSPVFAVVTDGARRVLQVSDWTGGEGTKPATGGYVGASGLVTVIGNAIDIRGSTGAAGTTGTNGASSYTYIAYAGTANGDGFTTTFSEYLDYIAIRTTTTPIASPGPNDFGGLWKYIRGPQGAGSTVPGPDGTPGQDGGVAGLAYRRGTNGAIPTAGFFTVNNNVVSSVTLLRIAKSDQYSQNHTTWFNDIVVGHSIYISAFDKAAQFKITAKTTQSTYVDFTVVGSGVLDEDSITPPLHGIIAGTGGPQGPQGIQGLTGGQGVQGNRGWSPVFAVVTDGVRRVLQVSDWTGGEGTKPATGGYVGASGLVTVIGNGIDIRGSTGAAGTNGTNGTNGINGTNGTNAFVYVAYASDANGTGFTTTFDPALDYIAVRTTTTAIVSPSASTFTGLWKNIKGAQGPQGPEGGPPGPAGPPGPVGPPGATVLTPLITWVNSSGLDSTGVVGNPSFPFLTAQAAWNAGARNIELGAGNYTITYYSVGNSEEIVRIRGLSRLQTTLTLNWSGITPGPFEPGYTPKKPVLISDRSVAITLNLIGTSATEGNNEGGSTPTYKLFGCYLASITFTPGSGTDSGANGTVGSGVFYWCEIQGTVPTSSSAQFYATLENNFFRSPIVGTANAAPHTTSHVTGGNDKIRDATASQDGLMTAAYAEKLDGITPSRVYMLTENITTSSAAGAGLLPIGGVPIAAYEKILVEVIGYRSTTSTTSGMFVRVDGPTSGSPYVRFGLEHWTATSVSRTSLTAEAFLTSALEGAGSADVLPFRAYATVINGSTAGTIINDVTVGYLQVRVGPESGGSLTVLKGAVVRITRIP